MKRFLLCLFALALVVPARADLLGHAIEISPAAGWIQVDAREPGQPNVPFPTIKYVPKDGRNAAILLTLMPSNVPGFAVTDPTSLKQFNFMSARPYLPSPTAKPAVTEFRIVDGIGVYMINEDPALIGKPAPPGEYKIATTVSILIGVKYVIHCTLFTDRKDSPDFQQGLQIVRSARVVAAAAQPAAPVKAAAAAPAATVLAPAPVADDPAAIGRGGLSAALHLPANRFQPSDLKINSDPGYFAYVDDRGVMLTGWLDQSKRFKGMKTFWVGEKTALEEKAGIHVGDESIKIINGWNAVLYTVPIGDHLQKNIRACRVVGDTWADVHLSIDTPSSTWKDLESVVSALTLTPKAP